jgi:pyrroline-5-carboxylate reductase
MFDGQKIAFIGSGTMAEAMIRGLLVGNVVQADQIVASGPRTERGEALAARHGVAVTCDNAAAAEAGQVVVLAVKPQVVPVVLPELRGHLRRQDLLLSIVAGMPIRRLADGAAHAAVVRAMPNTPAQIEQGISVWTATAEVDPLQRDRAQAVLAALGEEIYVDHEGDLDKATALSGSGPAYVFMMMEAMIDAGVHLGFSRRVARQLVFRTMAGSVAYAEQSGKHVAELRNQVTSPGGTTAAALYHLEKGGLRTVISRGLWAAFERSRSLGAQED